MDSLLDRAPVDNGATHDHKGRPAFGQEFAKPIYSLIRPLADPWGGTKALNGRHPTKMAQPVADQSANKVVFLMLVCVRPCQAACAFMVTRICWPQQRPSMAMTSFPITMRPSLNSPARRFRFLASRWRNALGQPRVGFGIHGFNFQVQLYDTSARSCLWVVPGTHKEGKIDIEARVADNNGSESSPMPYRCTVMPVTSP